jgi:hypothetical protein
MDINHLTVEELKIVKDAINQKINQLGDNTSQEETLEEAAFHYSKNKINKNTSLLDFTKGAKWQAERMYSEQDMQEYATFCIRCHEQGLPCIIAQDWFKLYKN